MISPPPDKCPRLWPWLLLLLLARSWETGVVWGRELVRWQPDGSLVLSSEVRILTTAVLVPSGEYTGRSPKIPGFGRQSFLSGAARSWPPRPAPTCRLPTPDLAALIDHYARQYDVDPRLVHLVIQAESGYQPQAVSPKGAMGLMQLMPETAAMLGVRDPFDVEQNLQGGIRYLKMCLERFNRQLPLALAAYNAGPERVSRHNGIPPLAETVEYVRKIMTAYTGNAASLPPGPAGTLTSRPPSPQASPPRAPLYLGTDRVKLLVSYVGQAKIISLRRF